jgi:hypothetical protein
LTDLAALVRHEGEVGVALLAVLADHQAVVVGVFAEESSDYQNETEREQRKS